MPTISGILKQLAREGKHVVGPDGPQDPEEVLGAMREPDLREAVLVEQSDGREEVRLVQDGVILTDCAPVFRIIPRPTE